MGLAGVALGAFAAWEVVDHPAEGVLAAGGSERAGVDTLAGFAKLVQRAVGVDRARHWTQATRLEIGVLLKPQFLLSRSYFRVFFGVFWATVACGISETSSFWTN